MSSADATPTTAAAGQSNTATDESAVSKGTKNAGARDYNYRTALLTLWKRVGGEDKQMAHESLELLNDMVVRWIIKLAKAASQVTASKGGKRVLDRVVPAALDVCIGLKTELGARILRTLVTTTTRIETTKKEAKANKASKAAAAAAVNKRKADEALGEDGDAEEEANNPNGEEGEVEATA
jgi:hypothetical protein